jgi:hypothetical protein
MRTTERATTDTGTHDVWARGFAALRIFTGLVWLSNGLAKLFDKGSVDWGFFSFTLITRGAAHGIATDAAAKTQIAPLAAFYRDVVLPHWGFFGTFLTGAELAVWRGSWSPRPRLRWSITPAQLGGCSAAASGWPSRRWCCGGGASPSLCSVWPLWGW